MATLTRGRGPSGSVRRKEGRDGRPRALPWFPVVKFYDPATGQRRERWLEPHKTQAAAKRALRDALAKMDHQQWSPSTERTTVADYLTQRWLPSLATTLRETTVVSYSLHVRAYIVPRLGGMRLDQVTGADLAAFYGHLRTGGGQGGRALSEATVARVHATVSRAMADAVEAGLIAQNPARSVPRVSRPKQRRPGDSTLRYWAADDLRRFLAGTAGERLHPALHLAAFTGMRRGEVLGLRWQDVDLDAALITVRQTRTSATDLVAGHGTRVMVGEPKTGRGRRIDLDPATVAVLRAWRRQQAEDRLALGGAWPDHGLVFTQADGEAPHPDTLSGVFDRLVKVGGQPRITLHGLRHTHATVLLAAGTPVKVVSERLGHRDVTTTLNYYGHVIPGIQAQAAATFAAAVGGA